MKTCLIVDDSRVIRKVARSIVEKMGFTCLEAQDGNEALKVCDEGSPDLIILDWNMPVMNGMEFMKSIRSRQGGEKPKIIFCTTENQIEKILDAISHGADEYVMKPFDEDILRDKINQCGFEINA